ncbi:hypothetical protein BDV95DRAFT_600288 [Massariosphaeria phaeospora]|uniref:F-box domain-containing protein n=1 Tax=Massariosphaeria phaeospora TaxID=100035 RepID=A0A7C8HY75_9PLEO|nr:hypothetical protein BDV95DRAFT_600288 [Massariosphaeria phaeospora]
MTSLLTLPAELRLQILSHVLQQPRNAGLLRTTPTPKPSLLLDSSYTASRNLSLLLTCHQFQHDFTQLAFSHTTFVVTDMYSPLATLLRPLQLCQLSSLRRIAFVAGTRQFEEMVHWCRFPFNTEALRLEELSVVLHRSAYWIYLSDFTTEMVGLLRRLENVKVLRFIRNMAHVKGDFRTWYNRMIGLVLKEDHYQRYDALGAPNVESTWWEWSYVEEDVAFELVAQDAKPVIPEDQYMEFVKPKVERLVKDMELEEEDSDPRSRNGWG